MSLRKAIDQKCAECIYDPLGGKGSWREQVGECTDLACPLFPVRPLPSGKRHYGKPAIPNIVKLRRRECQEHSSAKAALLFQGPKPT